LQKANTIQKFLLTIQLVPSKL